MKIERPTISLDVESTGTNVTTDRIVSLAMIKTFPDKTVVPWYGLFNPDVKMTDENIAIHGITNEQVADKDPFYKSAGIVFEFLHGCDLIGFNLYNFDLPIIDEELRRSGHRFDWTKARVIDVGNIFKKKEERSLEAAVLFYLNRKHEGAHNSLHDATATQEVLHGQLARYPDLSVMDVVQLSEFSLFEKRVDLAGKIVLDKDGEPSYSFGAKTKGVKVRNDLGFAYWILGKDFPEQTKEIIRGIIQKETTEPSML